MPFKGLGLHPSLVQATRDLGYFEPTPVQAEAIPPILAGRDLIATAQTGTGKTAAYVLPILNQLLGMPPRTTRVAVITPTRELAHQVAEVLRGLAAHTRLRTGLLVGGAAMAPQEKSLREGSEVLIATPGRLLDHMQRDPRRFDSIQILVLDEADRMLDMGFLPDIKRIIGRLPSRRQTLLLSATMPPVIARLAQDILRKPVSVQIGRRTTAAVGITQAAYPVPEHLKTPLLRHLLRSTEMPSLLVFTRTRRSARRLARVIASDGFAVAELHSDRSQSQRNRAMEGFRRCDFQVLVATNIAARGLDVEHITHVISFDVPDVPDDYIHRVGRTARAGAEGDAFVLVSPREEGAMTEIERQIGQRLPRVLLPDFDYSLAAPEPSRRPERHARGGRDQSRAGAPKHGARPAALPHPTGIKRSGANGQAGGVRRSQHRRRYRP